MQHHFKKTLSWARRKTHYFAILYDIFDSNVYPVNWILYVWIVLKEELMLVQKLKKRRLWLKDTIVKLESKRIPDMDA